MHFSTFAAVLVSACVLGSSTVGASPAKAKHTTTTTTTATSSSTSSAPTSQCTLDTSDTVSSSVVSSTDATNYVAYHNAYRCLFDAAPFTWDDSLAEFAQGYAQLCNLSVSSNSPYGENLAWGSGGAYTIPEMIGDWVDEYTSYDPTNPQPSHFTQVVWQSSTSVGCYMEVCAPGTLMDASYGTVQLYVCEYNPSGNWDGEYGDNVDPTPSSWPPSF